MPAVTVLTATSLDDFDRSIIARVVLSVYSVAIVLDFVLIVLRAWLDGDWSNVFNDAGELIKTAVLPILTLVLGYYFGKSKNQ